MNKFIFTVGNRTLKHIKLPQYLSQYTGISNIINRVSLYSYDSDSCFDGMYFVSCGRYAIMLYYTGSNDTTLLYISSNNPDNNHSFVIRDMKVLSNSEILLWGTILVYRLLSYYNITLMSIQTRLLVITQTFENPLIFLI